MSLRYDGDVIAVGWRCHCDMFVTTEMDRFRNWQFKYFIFKNCNN